MLTDKCFGTSQFVTYSYSDISSYYSEYKLRPSSDSKARSQYYKKTINRLSK